MDDVLLLLLKRNAHVAPLRISTTEIGRMLNMSQQNASRRLVELEKEEKILRKEGKLLITKKGMEEILQIYGELQDIFDKKAKRLEFSGEIVEGLGEGRYYVQRYGTKIKEKLGYEPYPGTLNIKLDAASLLKRQLLREMEPIVVEEFEESGRRYGGLFIYKCQVNKYDCAIVIPLRTHHGIDVLEIIARERLKEKLGKGKIHIKLVD